MTTLSSIKDLQLITLLNSSAVGVMPTDTIYGVVALASDPQAVARLYRLKEREHKPGTIIAASVEQLIDLGVDETMLRSVAHLWPNPLSIVVPAAANLAYLDQEVGSLAVRIPRDDDLRALLEKIGPLVTSSANHPGQAPADTLQAAEQYFGDQVDFYVDGGNRSNRPASTVVRLHPDGTLEMLRAGAVIIDEKGNIA